MGTPRYFKVYLRSMICSVAILAATNSEPYRALLKTRMKSSSSSKLSTCYDDEFFMCVGFQVGIFYISSPEFKVVELPKEYDKSYLSQGHYS